MVLLMYTIFGVSFYLQKMQHLLSSFFWRKVLKKGSLSIFCQFIVFQARSFGHLFMLNFQIFTPVSYGDYESELLSYFLLFLCFLFFVGPDWTFCLLNNFYSSSSLNLIMGIICMQQLFLARANDTRSLAVRQSRTEQDSVFLRIYRSLSFFFSIFLSKRILIYVINADHCCFQCDFKYFLHLEFLTFQSFLTANRDTEALEKHSKMQNPSQRSYKCEKHSDQQIMFVCAVNDWHFEPLCQLCTPGHTQNHAKRLKINLESFEQINKKVSGKELSVVETYKKQIKKISQVQGKYQLQEVPIIKDLKLMQEKIIGKVKAHFSELNQKVSLKLKQLINQNNEKIKNLATNLQNEIKCIEDISKPDIDLYAWKNAAKKIYFQDKLESYLQESKQIIQEFEQKCVEITAAKKKQLFTDQNKFLTSLVALINSQVKSLIGQNLAQPEAKGKLAANNVKKPESKDLVKRPIVKQKSKQCKNCNQEMQYLTQNKKHLICRFCNQKQRNYTKKTN